MKYIKLFNTTTEYEAFKNGEDWVLPNLSLIEETYEVKMTPLVNSNDPANGFEYVDLGLPSGTLWATCNVGASKPEETGLYFSWGDSQGYTKAQVQSGEHEFYPVDDKWNNGDFTCDASAMIKYNTEDGKTVLDPEDDAAVVNMGGDWHMPTKEQCEELTANTTSTWTTMNGVNGRLFTSKTNGNTLFVPAAGYCNNGSVDNEGSYAFVWSSSLSVEDPYRAWYLYSYSSGMDMFSDGRCYGLSVRGVLG